MAKKKAKKVMKKSGFRCPVCDQIKSKGSMVLWNDIARSMGREIEDPIDDTEMKVCDECEPTIERSEAPDDREVIATEVFNLMSELRDGRGIDEEYVEYVCARIFMSAFLARHGEKGLKDLVSETLDNADTPGDA